MVISFMVCKSSLSVTEKGVIQVSIFQAFIFGLIDIFILKVVPFPTAVFTVKVPMLQELLKYCD
jgi:hypothetical protein